MLQVSLAYASETERSALQVSSCSAINAIHTVE